MFCEGGEVQEFLFLRSGASGFSGARGGFGAAAFRYFRSWSAGTARRGLRLTALDFVVVHRCGDRGENFVGEVWVVDGAGDDERANEAGVGGERFLAAKIAGVALNVARDIVEEGPQVVGEGGRGGPGVRFRRRAGPWGGRGLCGRDVLV